jgi:Tfp pilus assembly protein PilO
MTQSEVVQIDKRFIVVIVTLLLQTAGVIWWASSMTRQVEGLQATDVELKAADQQIRLDATATDARLRAVEQGAGRMEAQLASIQSGIERLHAQIERLIEDRP